MSGVKHFLFLSGFTFIIRPGENTLLFSKVKKVKKKMVLLRMQTQSLKDNVKIIFMVSYRGLFGESSQLLFVSRLFGQVPFSCFHFIPFSVLPRYRVT